MAVDLRTEGTLLLALTGDDQSRLKHVLAFQKSLGLPLEWLTTAEVRRREPHLTPTHFRCDLQSAGPSGRQSRRCRRAARSAR